jgi:hypothetical protein
MMGESEFRKGTINRLFIGIIARIVICYFILKMRLHPIIERWMLEFRKSFISVTTQQWFELGRFEGDSELHSK